jgi:hypothetical protein
MKKLLSTITLLAFLTTVGLTGTFAQIKPTENNSTSFPATIQSADKALTGLLSNSEIFIRTELYFGTQKPDGSEVSDAEFKNFLDAEITPRFPDGLTLLTGFGQFRNSSGVIVQEKSKLLILLYPINTLRPSSTKIEEIRTAYKAAFQQQSVLRADALPVRVSF